MVNSEEKWKKIRLIEWHFGNPTGGINSCPYT